MRVPVPQRQQRHTLATWYRLYIYIERHSSTHCQYRMYLPVIRIPTGHHRRLSLSWLLLLAAVLFVWDHSHHHVVTAFATSPNANANANININANINKGIPDPPAPVLRAKNPPVLSRRDRNTPIPVTILAGFLGSGKTTLLQSMLLQDQGLRIAVIVNDVAAINIDRKLIRPPPPVYSSSGSGGSGGSSVSGGSTSSSDTITSSTSTSSSSATAAAAGILELQNGCACCSKSEEFMMSLADMVTLNDLREEEEQFDHIVIELSGIANPANIRSMWHDAMLYQMPLMDRIVLDTMVTVVDCSNVMNYLHSSATANPMQAPELFTEENNNNNDSDMDMDHTQGGNQESVAELIVAQIEISDIILLNKIDLLRRGHTYSNRNENDSDDNNDNDQEELNQITDLLYRLNPKANHIPTVYANVPLVAVLGQAKGQGVALAGILDDHKDAVQFAASSTTSTTPTTTTTTTPTSSVASDTVTADDASSSCGDAKCTDPTHTHDHHHHHHQRDDDESLATSSASSTCTDPTHSHDHDHHHTVDPTPSSLSSSTISTTPTQHAGIGSFVYCARRPFHPLRLHTFLRHLPITRGLTPEPRNGNDDQPPSSSSLLTIPKATQNVMRNIIRSKGFIWIANSNVAALYLSQAGTNLDVSCLGSWWATLPRSDWPPEAVETVLEDFDSRDHAEDSIDSDNHNMSVSVGDRRQELVFIGKLLGTHSVNVDIANVLDQCLLSDTEYELYCKSKNDEATLTNLFPLMIPVKQMN